MRIVVTGREGQVVQSLLERAKLVGAGGGAVILPVGRPELDLSVAETIAPAIRAARPDVIINAAAYTAVDKAESEPALAAAINGAAAGVVAETAASLGVPVVHVSTDYVFSGDLDRPYVEDDPVGPLGVYGDSKLAGERAVTAATANHAILRTAWVYSPFGKNFLKTMLTLGETRDTLNVVADQHGAPTSALDLADALLVVARNLVARPSDEGLRGVFHASGTGYTTWAGFASAIFDAAARHGRKPVTVNPIPASAYPTPARRPTNSRLNCDKLATVHGARLPEWRTSTERTVARLLASG
jgi:dTDP-4-dehydrorhamnose reductase